MAVWKEAAYTIITLTIHMLFKKYESARLHTVVHVSVADVVGHWICVQVDGVT